MPTTRNSIWCARFRVIIIIDGVAIVDIVPHRQLEIGKRCTMVLNAKVFLSGEPETRDPQYNTPSHWHTARLNVFCYLLFSFVSRLVV